MINTISFTYPWWYVVLCFAISVGFAALMYYRDTRFAEYGPWVLRILAVFRTLTIFIITLLLLSPLIKTIKEDTKSPVILIASDVSESMASGIKPDDLNTYNSALEKLGEGLSQKYEVKHISFGSKVYPEKKDSLTDKSTNFSALLQYISDNYADQNLGAVIVGSDGIFNEGSNPLYSDFGIHAPLYTIAMGDTTQKKDLYFQNVLFNKIAYLGDKIPVQVDISAYNCLNQDSRFTLEVIENGAAKKVHEEMVQINSSTYFSTKTIIVDANKSGAIRYRLKLSAVSGEFNTINNVREFFIEVLDGRQKILLLANAPHPDLSALKNIIIQNKNYQVDLVYARDFNNAVSGYNLVMFHNLPSESFDIVPIISQLNKNNTPRLFIVGLQTSLPKFNAIQNVIQISGNSKNSEEIQAEFAGGFTLFSTSDQLKNKLKTFPPLLTPFGDYKLRATAVPYLFQNIKKIKTNFPLLAFSDENGIKTSVFCGEGIWKWRMFDHLQNKNYDLVSELLNKTVLLTTVKTDKRKFRASTSKNLYKDNEQVLFEAQLFNESYELVNEPDVALVVKDEAGKDFQYTFSKTQNYYTLNADMFPKGSYGYTASVNFNGKVLTTNGRFNVESVQLEQFDLTARHRFLRSLSAKNNGEMVYLNGIESLQDMLLKNDKIKPVMYQSSSTKSIIHLKLIFFLLLFFLGIEWFIRRYFGNY